MTTVREHEKRRKGGDVISTFFPPIRWNTGRKDDEEDREDKWRRQLRATFMLCVLGDPPARIAAFFDVTPRTIQNWKTLVLMSKREEAEGLRRLAESVRRN